MNKLSLLAVVPAALAVFSFVPAAPSSIADVDTSESAVPMHPHFPKVLKCTIPTGRRSPGIEITVRYMTVTFDAEGAKKMAPGKGWHLAGAEIETSADMTIGGQKVAAGKYALSVRKGEKQTWKLTLHKGPRFSRPGKNAIELETEFKNDAPMFEHMNIDVQPAGDKSSTKLHLDVRFDKLLASALIELPKPAKKEKK